MLPARCANGLRSGHADTDRGAGRSEDVMKYSIPEDNMERLEKKLRRIGNKCRKYGCEFKYWKLGEHFEDLVLFDDDGRKTKVVVKYIDIEVEGVAQVGGWRFAAALEYTDKGNVIRNVSGLEIPERYYSCEPWCEHCKTRRDRKSSYIVFNDETGEFKQVGRACLADFTHGLSAEMAASMESVIAEVEESSHVGSGYSPRYYDVKEYMVYVAECIRLYGYVRSGDSGISTGLRAADMYGVDHRFFRGMTPKSVKEMYDEAVAHGFDIKNPASVELAAKVREWIVNNERDDNYFHNLKVACSLEYATGTAFGLLSSAFPTYNRELEYEAERRERALREAEAAAKSSWMGNVGDKVCFEISDFRKITSWETQWGMTYVYKMVDTDGREATWKTSNWLDEDCIGKKISGKIKELKEYRGIKQTELTRCRVA